MARCGKRAVSSPCAGGSCQTCGSQSPNPGHGCAPFPWSQTGRAPPGEAGSLVALCAARGPTPRALCWRPTNWSRPLLSFAAESRNWEERFCLASEEPPVSSESVMMFTVCRVLGAARRARRDGRRVERWNVCARVPLSLRRQSGAKRRPRARANPGCAIQPPAIAEGGGSAQRAGSREGRAPRPVLLHARRPLERVRAWCPDRGTVRLETGVSSRCRALSRLLRDWNASRCGVSHQPGARASLCASLSPAGHASGWNGRAPQSQRSVQRRARIDGGLEVVGWCLGGHLQCAA